MAHNYKVNEYVQSLSDAEIIELVEDMKLSHIPHDSIVRRTVRNIFGQEDILILQMNQLIWPLLEVATERMQCYSAANQPSL